MKKIICFILTVLTLCFLTSCGCNSDSVKNSNNSKSTNNTSSISKDEDTLKTTTPENSSSQHLQNSQNSEDTQSSKPISELVSSYKPPAKSFDIDLSKDDPSNDDIRFEYDDKGRISKCYYEVNDIEVAQAYIYTDDTVQIYAFNGSIVIDDITFDNVSYDENTGFNECDGYYLKNVKVSNNGNGKSSNNNSSSRSTITENEAINLVRKTYGFKGSEGYGAVSEGIFEKDNVKYYAIRIRRIVDEYHSSSLGCCFVKFDGSDIIQGDVINGKAHF